MCCEYGHFANDGVSNVKFGKRFVIRQIWDIVQRGQGIHR